MNLSLLIAKSQKFVTDNSPLILTGIGAAGVLTTAYLTGKAAFNLGDIHRMDEVYTKNPITRKTTYYQQSELEDPWTKFKWAAPAFFPAAGSAALTISAIVLSNRIGVRRTAALAAAYAVSESALSEYKEKVVEKIGKKKAREVTDQIAQEKIKGVNSSVAIVGEGEILCFDTYTMKPFVSTVERVRRVENDLREILLNPGETINCSDWLKGIGLRPTPYSDDFGWNGETGFKLDFTAGLTDDNKPCMVWHFAIEPQYKPKPTDRFQI